MRPDPYEGRARRDRLLGIALFGGLAVLLGCYWVADAVALVPEKFSVRYRRLLRRETRSTSAELALKSGGVLLDTRYEDYDPDLMLGVAIGDTRFRLNHAKHRALVTRPIFGIKDWVIPAQVQYQGATYTVTALDTFALLNASGVETLSLPASLEHINQADAFPPASLRVVTHRQADGSVRTYTAPFAEHFLGGDE